MAKVAVFSGSSNEVAAILKEVLDEPAATISVTRRRRGNGSQLEFIMLDILKDGKVHRDAEIKKAFKERNFSESSLSSTASLLKKAKKIIQVKPGEYRLYTPNTLNGV